MEGREYSIGGDVIVSVDGIDVRKIDDILIHLQRVKIIGDEMVLEVFKRWYKNKCYNCTSRKTN